jgi:hypothetical protein
MLQLFSKFFAAPSLLIFILIASGCGSGDEKFKNVYNNYRFDTAVINKLPLYDSLASFVSANIALFHKYTDTSEAYQAFRYMPTAYDAGVYRQLPAELDSGISPIYKALGEHFIYGFDVFKDSTIKIYIRAYPVKKTMVDIEENLAYYPTGKKMKQREFPVKDTVLNKQWQYWVRLNEQGLF